MVHVLQVDADVLGEGAVREGGVEGRRVGVGGGVEEPAVGLLCVAVEHLVDARLVRLPDELRAVAVERLGEVVGHGRRHGGDLGGDSIGLKNHSEIAAKKCPIQ